MVLRGVRCAWIGVFFVVAAAAFAQATVPDGFWQSVLQIREGAYDFGGTSVGKLFRDVTFQSLALPSGASTTFSIVPKSFDGTEVILEYSVLMNGAVLEYFDFHFHYKGKFSVLYKLSRGEAKLEGYEQMRRIMREFYLPSLVSD